ncbi:MAG TPA: hypothetical protein ENJ10_07865 [Caldithrix abyssi]|uniref:Uncharacterized protein n=1 Tax=Caldithrix abyssi TaxID=187145 RepID=A0A7V1PV49_CALAY|nr:hypothetical protein [Caldithrix abyssi]
MKTVFSGNIVEIRKHGEQVYSKVLLKPFCLDVPLKNMPDIHLGDQLDITCEYTISRIRKNDAGFPGDPCAGKRF